MTVPARARGTALLLVLLAVLAGAAAGASADQTAPELDQLFRALSEAGNAHAGALIEQRIWALWFAAPEPEAARLLEQARAAAEAGAPDAALALFGQLTSEYPEFAEGWNQRAIMHYLVGDIERALDDIARTLELEPRHFGALAGRGQCYLKLERPHESLQAFEESLDINPWSTSVVNQIEMLEAYLEALTTPI